MSTDDIIIRCSHKEKMKRKQLTIFLEEKESEIIETMRKRYNPRQCKIIKSHITLCREDEIEDLKRIQCNLENLDVDKFELPTNGLRRFSEGKGVLISIIDEEQKFQKLREVILQNEELKPRKHISHITLMHPRNSICDDTKFKELQSFKLPSKISISKISLIEQENGMEWITLKEYELKNKSES